MKCHSLIISCTLIASNAAWAEAPAEPEWPLRIEGARAPIVLYQPQPDALKGNKLTGRAAVSVQPKGQDPVFGAVWIEARLATDRQARTATVEDVQIPRARFAGATPEQEKTLAQILAEALKQRHFVIQLDRLLVSLENAEREVKSAEDLKADPPKIFVEREEAVLVLVDGEPELRAMKDSKDRRVVNTPSDMTVTAKNQWRLKAAERWLTAPALEGPWADESDSSAKVPKVIVSKEPAELIVSKGEPVFVPFPDNQLLYMSNTDNDVFVETAGSKVFVLLSGRWFSAPSLKGPWTFVRPDQLPAAFAKIPPASPKASVRTSVAGTAEAQEALIDTQIPQTAVVSRKDKDGKLQVAWDGEAKFQEIAGLSVAYALNASQPVFRVGTEGYWACAEGVWYASKKPDGPWVVATYVPKDIYKIPPSCPYYNCRYVHVYEAHPDVVYCGYYPGYVGCYPYYGTVVYGTGYYYHGWYGPVYAYPPPMMTWGFSFRYNPYTGWGVGVAWGMGGAGWVVVGGGGGPVYGGGWWGPGGYPGYRPPGAYPPGRAHVTPYDRNQGRQNIYDRSGDRGAHASQQPSGGRDRGASVANRDVYADRDGNVSRRNSDGQWQDRAGSDWKNSAGPRQDVQRDYQARDRGAQRASQYQSSSRPSGGYSGGGMRGGGGRGGGRR